MPLDRTNARWEPWEEEILINLAPRRTYKEIGKTIGRSEGAVGLKIVSMKRNGRWPHENKHNAPWSAEEDEVLIQMRGSGAPHHIIAQRLPGRSTGAVSRRWSSLRKRGVIAPLCPDDPPREESPKESNVGCCFGSDQDAGNQVVITAPPDIGERILTVIGHLELIRKAPDQIESILNRLEQSATTIKYAGVIALALLEEGKRREKAVRDLLPNYGINEERFFEDVDTLLANREASA